MNYKQFSPFLKELVSDEYAFFWQVYEGKLTVRQSAVKRLRPLIRGQQLEVIDSKPPCLVLKGNAKRYYPPLRKNPVLHRTFCEITGDKDIVKFVSKFGLLGFTSCRDVRKRDGTQNELVLVESLARWKEELAEMKRLIHLWELVKNARLSLLSALISREDDGIYIIIVGRKSLVADSRSPLARKWDREGEQPLEAARKYLTDHINGKIGGSVFPMVMPLYKKSIYLSPGNLLSAMWLMFLWEVIGEVRPCQCPGCGEWFDPRRNTRKTCGDRCRKKISRLNTVTRESLIQ